MPSDEAAADRMPERRTPPDDAVAATDDAVAATDDAVAATDDAWVAFPMVRRRRGFRRGPAGTGEREVAGEPGAEAGPGEGAAAPPGEGTADG